MITEYLGNLAKTYQKGDAREESYYEHLSAFLQKYSQEKRNKVIDITTLPKKTEAGNPDFRVWDSSKKHVGYIEAKTLGTNLDTVEDSEQLKRYISTFPNVILTNFTEFRLYRNGEIVEKIFITRDYIITKVGVKPPVEHEEEFFNLLNRFLDFSLPRTFTAKSLAVELAKRTSFLKDQIVTREIGEGNTDLLGFFEAFQQFLIAGINEAEFADLYSQTVTYGLFAARLRSESEFNRTLAFTYIPKSIGILRDIFKFISLDELPRQMQVIIDDITEVLAAANVKNILEEYYQSHKGDDPVVHFYETFLSVYDPATREKRGVYYTPEPVVGYIVRSLHKILKEKFNKTDGFADRNVKVLDPAGGTLGFLAKAIEVAVEEYNTKHGSGGTDKFIKEHILQNFYAFELMMAPYAIGHMKMSFLLEELGYKMSDDERVKYYLTNTLEMKELDETKFPGMSSLSKENHDAGKVKKDAPILVIMGNPPYSYDSPNKGEWISKTIKEYYQIEGIGLGEKNPKGLQDDYVKFIRFAQWKIDKAGEGIVGFITNHGYLENPTFKGMRYSLMKSFDEIYILDLHGNNYKKEAAPDGSPDNNVFDIKQGVAIIFLIKYAKNKTKKLITHNELYGLRNLKYEWLNSNILTPEQFEEINPAPEFYLFNKQDKVLKEKYNKLSKISNLFFSFNSGLFTSRDYFVVDRNQNILKKRIFAFQSDKIDKSFLVDTYGLKGNSSWNIDKQREILRKDENWQIHFQQILYRPFDIQWIYYHDALIERSRKDIMRHMFQENIAITIGRQASAVGSDIYDIVFISNFLVDLNLFRRGGELLFPLYLYPEVKKDDLFSEHESGERQPNIKPELFTILHTAFGNEVTPEQIFYYIYGVLYSNIYRTKYNEFLRIDFPRVPFTGNYELFIKIGETGKKIAALHLLKSDELNNTISKFEGKGECNVIKPVYKDDNVFINETQRFTGIPEEVWNYKVGGYQVCEKWLKDRKKRYLSLEEIETYSKIVTALSKTIEYQTEIDELYNNVEDSLLEVNL